MRHTHIVGGCEEGDVGAGGAVEGCSQISDLQAGGQQRQVGALDGLQDGLGA